MKKLIIVLALVAGLVANANNTNPVKNKKKTLHTQIVKLLGTADFSFDRNLEATINFVVNTQGQIIVLSVVSKNELIDSYVKRKLNYQKVTKHSNTVKIYKIEFVPK